jgi:hypothetical protein
MKRQGNFIRAGSCTEGKLTVAAESRHPTNALANLTTGAVGEVGIKAYFTNHLSKAVGEKPCTYRELKFKLGLHKNLT